MVDAWRKEALDEIANLKPYWVAKHDWQPEHVVSDDAIDLYVHLVSRRLNGREFLLRLRYLSDWQTAGRRETFVNLEDRSEDGTKFWPPTASVRGVNPEHRPQPPNGPIIPCICLKGVWGYHSVLHANERPDGTTLVGFLVELQGVLDEVGP